MYGHNEKTDQPTDTLKLRSIASRVPLAYSLLGDAYYKPNEKGNHNQLQAIKYYMEAEKHGMLGKNGAMRVLDYCQNNNDFKFSADDMKRLEIIAIQRRNATE